MKNKTAVLALLVLIFTASVSHARWGLDIAASPWKMDAKDMLTSKATYAKWASLSGNRAEGYVDQRSVGGSALFFMEGNSRFRFGLSAGVGVMPETYEQVHQVFTAGGYKNTDLRTKTIFVPVDLYLKYTSKAGGFSMYGGGGADFATATSKYQVINTQGGAFEENATFSQKKMFTHAQAGFEFFLTKWLSVNAGAKVMLNAVMDNMTGKVTRTGTSPSVNEKKMFMTMDGTTNTLKFTPRTKGYTLAAGEKAYQYDYSGVHANVGLRIYFK